MDAGVLLARLFLMSTQLPIAAEMPSPTTFAENPGALITHCHGALLAVRLSEDPVLVGTRAGSRRAGGDGNHHGDPAYRFFVYQGSQPV